MFACCRCAMNVRLFCAWIDFSSVAERGCMHVDVYMCAKCVVAYVKNHYSSTKRLIFAQYICMRRVCATDHLSAGSICTLITLHFAVSFTITNNSFDVEALYRSYCLIRPSSIQSIWGREVCVHSFQRALLSQSHCISSILLYGVLNVFVMCCGCITHKQTHAYHTIHTPWTTQFHLISTTKHTCIQSTHTLGNAIKYNAIQTRSSAKWMPKTLCAQCSFISIRYDSVLWLSLGALWKLYTQRYAINFLVHTLENHIKSHTERLSTEFLICMLRTCNYVICRWIFALR